MTNVHTDVVDKLKKTTREKLVNGDVLFRWVPKGINQRGLIQGLITGAQTKQMTTQYLNRRDDSAVAASAMVVQHVGIYHDGYVREIGSKGLESNEIKKRNNYDLVVRSKNYGQRITKATKMAIADRRQFLYPIWDLFNISHKPTYGYDARNSTTLNQEELAVHRGNSSPVRMKQAVVCSHFVHAVLYTAIVPGGTLRTATNHKFDQIFKISPSHMWTEFLHGKGVWGTLNAFYVGMQHKGILNRNVDPRILGVGLKMPPVPSKDGRPRIAKQT